MITRIEQNHIEENAYIPEHIVSYVTTVSQAEPFLVNDFLVYLKDRHLIFVGYPLKERFTEARMQEVLNEAIEEFNPQDIAWIAPSIPAAITGASYHPSDSYYVLDLALLQIPQKTRNMIRRARQELRLDVIEGLGSDHKELIEEFMANHPVDEATGRIYKKIPDYVSAAKMAIALEVRNKKGELVALALADFSSKEWAMYMFNFISLKRYVPGASDLLLAEIINQALKQDKRNVNLGLGVNPGVSFFKKKWGGTPLFPYTFCTYSPAYENDVYSLLEKL